MEATIFPTRALAPGFPKPRLKPCVFTILLEGVWAEERWVRLGEWACGSEGKQRSVGELPKSEQEEASTRNWADSDISSQNSQ